MTMVRRGSERRLDAANFQAELLTTVPVSAAALSRRLDRPDDAQGLWMRADPVILRPDLNAVWLEPDACLDPQSHAVDSLKELFAGHGLDFDIPVASRGYLRLTHPPDCDFRPPWRLAGESLDFVQPEGEQAGLWKQLLSETQIVLHQYRAESGDDQQANGLWFWGPGQLPQRDPIRSVVSHVVSSDPGFLALSDWLALSAETSTAHALQVPADASLVEFSLRADLDADENLARLDDFLRPLWRRLKWGRLDALQLADRGYCWTIRPMQAWNFLSGKRESLP
jgi:hypothetical protein